MTQLLPIPSNKEVGIDIDDYIGHPIQSPESFSHEYIVKRTVLSGGDPAAPSKRGAVLRYSTELATATLKGNTQTPLVNLPDQQLLYVEEGQGQLDDGSRCWDLRKGTGVLIAPGATHRFKSTTDAPLQMILATWQPEDEARPVDQIRVRNIDQVPTTPAAHWDAYIGKGLFGPDDGLHPNEAFSIVHVPPMMMGDPHAHDVGFEEVWLKLAPDDAYMLLGSALREMPVHTAYLCPPNGKTVHSNLNLIRDKTQQWFYYARFPFPLARNPDWPVQEPKQLDQT